MATATRPIISNRPSARGSFRPAVLVGGLGLLIALGYAAASILGTRSAPDHFDRTTVGGSLTVEVEASGPVVVYVEASRAVLLAELALTVTDASGREVVVDAYGADLRYDRGGGLGTAVGTFDAAAAGRFQLDSAAPLGTIAIAVGPDIGTELQAAIGRAGLIAGIGLLAGLAFAALAAARPTTASRAAVAAVPIAAVTVALLGLVACTGGPVQGHAEIGPNGGPMELGSIGTAASGAQRLDLEAEVTDGAGRIELVAGDGTVAWAADVTPGRSPIRAFAEIEGPGPWTVRLVATEKPLRLDYRLDR